MKLVKYEDQVIGNFYLIYFIYVKVVLKYQLKSKYGDYRGTSVYYASRGKYTHGHLPRTGTLSKDDAIAMYYELSQDEIESAIIEVL